MLGGPKFLSNPPKMIRRLSTITGLVLLAALAGTASAQSATDSTRMNLFSINPLGVVFEYFSVEGEHALSKSTSLALSGAYASPSDFTYVSVDLIGRYYPAERGLRGFAIGPTVGYTHASDSCCSSSSDNAFTVGVQFDYSWIVGPSQHFGIELGAGAKRLFYQGSGGGSTALPTGRLSVGYAF
jgi:hypothetical protein